MHDHSWQPAAPLANIQARAVLLARLRAFFAARGVMEVETPLLAPATGSDINLGSLEAWYRPVEQGEGRKLYLQTSPEFAMKRLLAAGSGSIFQICKAFRNGESGARHNPEFTMLEWYRTGFDERRLMAEVEDLLHEVLDPGPVRRASYQSLFEEYLDINPHRATAAELARKAAGHVEADLGEAGIDTWLDLLFSHVIEPALKGAVFVHDFPAGQAALARITADSEGQPVARRFELLIDGLEIANGYFELADAAEQADRFRRDRALRRAMNLPEYPPDEKLLAALTAGLPDCAGVALGVDRLLMLETGAKSIQEVLAFPLE